MSRPFYSYYHINIVYTFLFLFTFLMSVINGHHELDLSVRTAQLRNK